MYSWLVGQVALGVISAALLLGLFEWTRADGWRDAELWTVRFAIASTVLLLLNLRALWRYTELTAKAVDVNAQQAGLAAKQLRLAEAANIHRMLTDLWANYGSTDMHAAVKAIRDLHRDHPTNFVTVYEQKRLSGDPLDNQRRTVSHFYALLSALYDLEVVAKKVVYVYWSELDLRIIPEVLLPLELHLEQQLYGSPTPTNQRLLRMKKLYDDAPKPTA